MAKDNYTKDEVKELLIQIVGQADAEIIYKLRTEPNSREDRLAELDALERLRSRIYATFE